MTLYYLDSTAWQKYYLREPGSDEVAKLFTQSNILVCNTVGFVEVVSSLWRKVQANGATQGQFKRKIHDIGNDWSQFMQIELSQRVLSLAAQATVSYGFYDNRALHLGSILLLKRLNAENIAALTIVSTDTALLNTATALGLATLNPTVSADIASVA